MAEPVRGDLGECAVDGCENQATRHTPQLGPLCDTHRKRTQPARDGTSRWLLEPVQPRLSKRARLRENALRYADADSESDHEWECADDALVKAAISYAADLRLARCRAERVRGHGRPPALSAEEAREAVEAAGSIAGAARGLRVDRKSVKLALQRGNVLPTHGAMHALELPAKVLYLVPRRTLLTDPPAAKTG